MAKADKHGWIRHRGGKCPVEAGVLVDYRMRDGEIDDSGLVAAKLRWNHIGGCADIMAYRIHKPEEQPVIERDYEMEAKEAGAVILVDTDIDFPSGVIHEYGPIEWRDRITEIDRTVEALEEERASLIQRLADEGLQLLQAKACGEVKSAEDISDSRKWEIGDLFTVIGGDDHYFEVGDIVALSENDGTSRLLFRKTGIESWIDTDCVKFHSRPST